MCKCKIKANRWVIDEIKINEVAEEAHDLRTKRVHLKDTRYLKPQTISIILVFKLN